MKVKDKLMLNDTSSRSTNIKIATIVLLLSFNIATISFLLKDKFRSESSHHGL